MNPRFPIHPDARELSRSDGVPAIEHALSDGEDFELCVVVSAGDAVPAAGRPSRGDHAFSHRRNHRGARTEAPLSRAESSDRSHRAASTISERECRDVKNDDPLETIVPGPGKAMHVERVNEGLSIDLASEDDTARLGGAIAELAGPGVVIALVGPLGAGKTRLVRAIAEALRGRSRGDFEPDVRFDSRVCRANPDLSCRRLSAARSRRL